MDENIKLKKFSYEPKVYCLLVSSAHGQILHIGVHFTLEEAYSAARAKMQTLFVHGIGESIEIEMWNNMDIKEILDKSLENGKSQIEAMVESMTPGPEGGIANLSNISQIKKENIPVSPEICDYIKNIKDSKNALMKRLIDEGDIQKVEEARDVLGVYSKRYVLKSIKEKNNYLTQSKDDQKPI